MDQNNRLRKYITGISRRRGWFFTATRFLFFAGVSLWLVATCGQLDLFRDEKSELLKKTLPLLTWFSAYSTGFLILLKIYPKRARILFQIAIVLDIAFITGFIMATGKSNSDFYLSYCLFIAIETFFFGASGGALVTFLSAAAYTGVYLLDKNNIFIADFLLRSGFMILVFIVIAAVEENERLSREAIQHSNETIASLNRRLEDSCQQLIDEKESISTRAAEISKLLQAQNETTQRRRSQMDFLRGLDAKDSIDEAALAFIRYIRSTLGADSVSLVSIERNRRRAFVYVEENDSVEKKEMPFIHPIIQTFQSAGGAAGSFSRTWIRGKDADTPDSFMTAPDNEYGLLHVEAVTGGERGVFGFLVISTESADDFDPGLLDEVRLLGNHFAVAAENLALRTRLQELADTDGLTGLYNHRFFQRFLDIEIMRAERYKRPVSIVIFDIDHFKKFNDNYGHPVGDAVLREVASIAKGIVREVDLAARYGGEEFAFVLPETDIKGAMILAERLRYAISAKAFELGAAEPLHITISAGVACLPHCKTKTELIATADQALYRAKGAGRDRVAS